MKIIDYLIKYLVNEKGDKDPLGTIRKLDDGIRCMIPSDIKAVSEEMLLDLKKMVSDILEVKMAYETFKIRCVIYTPREIKGSDGALTELSIEGFDSVEVAESLVKGGHISKMEILELIGEDFARKYWGFVEVEDE